MSIRQKVRPTGLYDRAEAAALELSEADREELIEVILNDPTYTRADVALYLNEQTNNRHEVTEKGVSGYKAKLLKTRKAT